MAASPPSQLRVENTGEEINSAMDSSDSSVTYKDEKPETGDLPKVGGDADEPFKKPALFAAPSLSSKRAVTAPHKAPAEASSVREDNKDESTEAKIKPTSESQKDPEKAKAVPETHNEVGPVKSKPESKPKVLPTKGPPPGKFPPLPYTEPTWGGKTPDTPYSLEILKNGAIVNTIPLKHGSFFVVGRLPVCDVSLEHPSISRYHAIIQYRGESGEGESVGEERGFYVHDLGSTHGTVVNKNKIPPKTYIRLKVGHVLKFGGSTRLFVLQGPEFDEEEESEFTVTELKERARKQRAELERRMMGGGSDNEDDEEENGESMKNQSKQSSEDSGCSWGMADDALPEDDSEENPFSTEFHEDQEAAYLKDPKKALQGFYDREGEELEFEYEEKGSGTWLCRIKLPVDDAMGRQLVAELTHTGKKKEATIQCCLEACRMLEARGLLRQEAVSRKRKKKNWEDEDYYDSDDDTFLDRTGTVERKRQERMKKAGKIEERPDTYDSLVAKLAKVEKELAETQKKLDAGRTDSSGSLTEDPLDAFMTAVRNEAEMDAVERRKLHVHVADLRKEAQKLRKLVELTRPAQLPSLLPSFSGGSETEKPKKALPLFGAMKGGSKFKLKTGTIGKLPPKRPNLPAELLNMKELPPGGEEEEEEEEDEEKGNKMEEDNDSVHIPEPDVEEEETNASISKEISQSEKESKQKHRLKAQSHKQRKGLDPAETLEQVHQSRISKEHATAPSGSERKSEDSGEPATESIPKKKKKIMGPSRPSVQLSSGQYPDDDPDYCVWVPPVGQTGDGRTHLNDKYGY